MVNLIHVVVCGRCSQATAKLQDLVVHDMLDHVVIDWIIVAHVGSVTR